MRLSTYQVFYRGICALLFLAGWFLTTPVSARSATDQVRLTIALDATRLATLCLDPGPNPQQVATQLRRAADVGQLLTYTKALGAVSCSQEDSKQRLASTLQSASQAGLVIDFGDGRVMTFCVDLGDDGQATGEEVLRASQLSVIMEYSGIGGIVCKIDSVGSNYPSESCFSHCTMQPGEECVYWTYSQLVNDQWVYSQLGITNTVIEAGDVEGWAWGSGSTSSGAQPPVRTFAAICQAATVTPTVTPTATRIPPTAVQPWLTPTTAVPVTTAPTATATPQSATATPTLFATATFTAIPTNTSRSVVVLPTAEGQPSATPAPSATAEYVIPEPSMTPQVVVMLQETPVAAAPPPAETQDVWLPLAAYQLPELPAPTAVIAPSLSPTVAPSPTALPSVTPLPEQYAAEPATRIPAHYPVFAGLIVCLLGCWLALQRHRRAP